MIQRNFCLSFSFDVSVTILFLCFKLLSLEFTASHAKKKTVESAYKIYVLINQNTFVIISLTFLVIAFLDVQVTQSDLLGIGLSMP